MSLNKLVCPECETVMRPKTPVAPGKKVKCPKCSHVFVARADADEVEDLDEVEEERPRKKKPEAKKKAPAKAEAKPVAKKTDEESETYGYIKDEGEEKAEGDDEDEEDGKPKINYGMDESVRDLRGPAIILLRAPTGWLQFVALVGALGWLAFTVMIIIPFAFPIPPDEKKSNLRGKEADDKKAADQKASSSKKKFLEVWQWIDFTEVVELEPPAFWACAFGFLLLAFYSGLIAFGSIKLLNMESREWGMAASIMAMLPIAPLGLAWVFAMSFQWTLRQIELEEDYITQVCIGVAVLLYLATLGIGIWTLITANNPTVKEGYDYKPE